MAHKESVSVKVRRRLDVGLGVLGNVFLDFADLEETVHLAEIRVFTISDAKFSLILLKKFPR